MIHNGQAHVDHIGESELDAKLSNNLCTSELSTQTRSPFPDYADILAERMNRLYRAKIPDRAQWDSYVDGVREAKLRALGVTLPSSECGAQESPIPIPFAPTTPSQSSRVSVSPSTVPSIVPTIGNQLLTQPYEIPNLNPDTPSASSCICPIVTHDMLPSSGPFVGLSPEYSILRPRRSASSVSTYDGLAPQSSTFQLRNSEDHKEIPMGLTNFPTKNEARSRSPSAFSVFGVHPISQLSSSVRGYPTENLTAHTVQNQIDGENLTPSNDQENGNIVFSDTNLLAKGQKQTVNQQARLLKTVTPDLQYPAPRSNHERIPEALERSLCEAQGNDPTIQNQLRETSSMTQPHDTALDNKLTCTRSPRSTSFSRDIKGLLDSQKPTQHRIPSEPVVSGLNALAPEFKSHISEFSSRSTMTSATMRPTAPAFTPIAASQLAPSSKEFSFSSTGPSFKPSTIVNGNGLPSERSSPGQTNGLFSPVVYPPSSKAAKKSKAIPISKPRNELRASGSEHEVQEDESGRITQAEGRQKRMRCSDQGTEQMSQHAFTGQAPLLTEEHQNGDFHEIAPMIHYSHVRQDSSSLQEATLAANRLKEIIDDLSASEGSVPPGPSNQDTDINRQASTVQYLAKGSATHDSRLRPNSPFISSQGFGVQIPRTNTVGSLKKRPIAHDSGHKQAPSSLTFDSSQNTAYVDKSQSSAESSALRKASITHSDASSSELTTPAHANKTDLDRPRSSITPRQYGGDTQGPTKGVSNGASHIGSSIDRSDVVLGQQESEKSKVRIKDDKQPHPRQNTDSISASNHYDAHPSSKDVVRSHFQDNAQGPESASSVSPPYPSHRHLPRTESESADSSITRMIAENARFSPSYKLPCASRGDSQSLQSTDSAEYAAISERESAFSSSDEAHIHKRRFSPDARINGLVSSTLQVRLAPLERTLADIQISLVSLVNQSSARSDSEKKGSKADISDADDEDDVRSEQSRTKSPMKHRSTDRFKTLAAQIATIQQDRVPAHELTSITNEIKGLKALFQENRPSFTDVKTVVEEVVGKQMRGRSGPIASSHQSATVEKNQLQISGLESMLKIAEGRAEDELKARRATEDALADAQRLLRLSLQDAAEQRESAEETERSLSAFHEERHEVLRRNALLEGTQESLQKAAGDLAEKNAALEGTLEEYRLSSAQWRDDIDSVRAENSNLRRTVDALKDELDDGIRGRQALRTKFDQLQDEMILASQNIAQDQSSWRRKEEEHENRYEVLASNHERENKRCKKMEIEIAALCKTSRLDKEARQQIIMDYEREIHIQSQAMRAEQDRMLKSIDHDRKSAEDKLNDLCTSLGNVTAKFDAQLGETSQAACTERTRYEQLLQEAVTSKASALRDHQNFHDQVMRDQAEQHKQVLQTAIRERQMSENEYSARLALAGEKMLHYEDKVNHLEEKLRIAQSAAQAAVEASQSKQTTITHPHQPHASASNTIPEKISPQALRESILVLQEQLQDREAKIERLEHKLSALGVDAPDKLKAQENEIAWLRELFDVRLGDLHDLIAALAKPSYDRESVESAAIRLKANLEMEQQDKERVQFGGQSNTPFASIASFTSSPRSFPLAAAAAWGNWRKGLKAPVSGDAGAAMNRTPSRSSASTRSLSSGLLTPPLSKTQGGPRISAGIRRAAMVSSGDRRESRTLSNTHPEHDEPYEDSPPETPSLMRTINYDADAMSTDAAQIQNAMRVKYRSRDKEEDDEIFGHAIAAFPEHL